MITKCDYKGCTKAGVCRAPKTRDLREYWHFCKEHAAEYNKNWNYYADMTPDEIEADWERQTFGSAASDNKQNADDYAKFINDFLTGRTSFDASTSRRAKSMPSPVVNAFKAMDLPISATWREIGAKYRALAKQYHPDTAKDKKGAAEKFAKISDAYSVLRTHFGKK